MSAHDSEDAGQGQEILVKCSRFCIQAQHRPPASNPLMSFLPLIFIVAIFYFLVFMPMQRQKKQQARCWRACRAATKC